MKKAIVEQMVLGSVFTNTWLLQNKETKDLIIIDPADHAELIEKKIQEMQGKPKAILLTHGHFDHMLGASDLRSTYSIPIYVIKVEQKLMESPEYNLSGCWAEPCVLIADEFLSEGSELDLAGFHINVMHTPGHTAGSCCYYLKEEEILFSGDTLFAGSTGRTDFPTSSSARMRESIKRLLTQLPDHTRVCPGHNEETTIGNEKRYYSFD